MSNQSIKARITSVVTKENEGIHGDSVMVRFDYEGGARTEDFGSPLLNEANLRIWRRLVLSVVLDEKVSEKDKRLQTFDGYRVAVEGQDVNIAFDGREVYALGRDPKNMFFPYEYGLWDLPS